MCHIFFVFTFIFRSWISFISFSFRCFPILIFDFVSSYQFFSVLFSTRHIFYVVAINFVLWRFYFVSSISDKKEYFIQLKRHQTNNNWIGKWISTEAENVCESKWNRREVSWLSVVRQKEMKLISIPVKSETNSSVEQEFSYEILVEISFSNMHCVRQWRRRKKQKKNQFFRRRHFCCSSSFRCLFGRLCLNRTLFCLSSVTTPNSILKFSLVFFSFVFFSMVRLTMTINAK